MELYKDFAYNPVQLEIPRSKMGMKHSHKTTYNLGQLVPIYWREVVPGSTCKMEMAEITRMQTPIFPIMDNAFIDTYFFFVPNRIIWDHWEEFMGENKAGFWEQTIDYEIPQIVFNSDNTVLDSGVPPFIKGDYYYPYAVQAGSLADHLGVPISDANRSTPIFRGEFEVNALPFRAFYKIYNDWFRDENCMNPMDFDTGDSDVTAHIGDADAEAEWPLWSCPEAAKLHDYFTSATPKPQKGPSVTIGLGNEVPVLFSETELPYNSTYASITEATGAGKPARFINNASHQVLPYTADSTYMTATKSLALSVDLSNVVGTTINELRQAFAVQRYYEKLARGGSRYTETLQTMWGVTSPDGRLQRAEYLGGCRRIVNIDQVIQTSETGETSPLGNTGAYSFTSQNEDIFTSSFTEHGILMGVQVIRVEHSYQDGLNKMFLRKKIWDYYNPTFANIGDQPIYNKELYLAGDIEGSKDNEAFGYQEAWAEYRYMNNQVSGEFRSKYHQTLDAWHFADNYSGLPSFSNLWMEESSIPLNRNIAVSDRLADQFMSDIFFKEEWTQPMPVYSIPGLIDHY